MSPSNFYGKSYHQFPHNCWNLFENNHNSENNSTMSKRLDNTSAWSKSNPVNSNVNSTKELSNNSISQPSDSYSHESSDDGLKKSSIFKIFYEQCFYSEQYFYSEINSYVTVIGYYSLL